MTTYTTTIVDPQVLRLSRLRSKARDVFRRADRSDYWAYYFVTLTYRPGSEPYNRNSTPGADLTYMFKRLRRRLDRANLKGRLSYMWVLEPHKDGRPHIHAILRVPRIFRLPFFDASRLWVHGWSRTERVRHQAATVLYSVKYATKAGPSGAWGRYVRTYGFAGFDEAMTAARWWRLPYVVREQFGSHHRVIRAPGGGWVSRLTGEWIPPDDNIQVLFGSKSIIFVRRTY